MVNIMSMKLILVGLFVLTSIIRNELSADTISVVTEEAYPHHYIKNNKLVGSAIDFVKAMLQKSEMDYQINIYPWARAYQMATHDPNVLIFSMARTKNREKHFKWVGEILPVDYALIRLKSRTEVAPLTLRDANNYIIGVVRNDVIHQYLKDNQFKYLNVVKRPEQNFAMLMAKRVDLVPYTLTTLANQCKDMNVDCTLFEPILSLNDVSTGLYMAFSQQTDDDTVNKVVKAYQELKTQGDYTRIIRTNR